MYSVDFDLSFTCPQPPAQETWSTKNVAALVLWPVRTLATQMAVLSSVSLAASVPITWWNMKEGVFIHQCVLHSLVSDLVGLSYLNSCSILQVNMIAYFCSQYDGIIFLWALMYLCSLRAECDDITLCVVCSTIISVCTYQALVCLARDRGDYYVPGLNQLAVLYIYMRHLT